MYNSESEEIFKSSANMQYAGVIGAWGANKGGKLILTNSTLHFKAHMLNFGQKEYEIPLKDIVGAGKTFQITLPTPNMIQIDTKDGKKYKFVVPRKDKQKWIDLISKYVSQVDITA